MVFKKKSVKTDILERVPMNLCSIKYFFVSIFLALLLKEMISIIHYAEG